MSPLWPFSNRIAGGIQQIVSRRLAQRMGQPANSADDLVLLGEIVEVRHPRRAITRRSHAHSKPGNEELGNARSNCHRQTITRTLDPHSVRRNPETLPTFNNGQ
jgi:hypothetical protein